MAAAVGGNPVVGRVRSGYISCGQAKIEKVGDQFGLILLKALREVCGLWSEATVTVLDKTLVVSPGPHTARARAGRRPWRKSRKGSWSAISRSCRLSGKHPANGTRPNGNGLRAPLMKTFEVWLARFDPAEGSRPDARLFLTTEPHRQMVGSQSQDRCQTTPPRWPPFNPRESPIPSKNPERPLTL